MAGFIAITLSSGASIIVLVVENHGTLLQYIATSKISLENTFDNYTLISEGSRIIGGLDCYEFVLVFTQLGSEIKLKQVVFVELGKAFLIGCGVSTSEYENMIVTFEASLSTFRITSASNDIPSDFDFLWIIGIVVVVIIALLVIVALRLRKKNRENPIKTPSSFNSV